MTKKLPDTSYPWGQMPPPTKEQFSFLAKAHRRRHGSLNAYYFSFEPTGVDAIDEILAAVAHAGRAYHHTESWVEPGSDGFSEVDRIQAAADAAADRMRHPDEVTS